MNWSSTLIVQHFYVVPEAAANNETKMSQKNYTPPYSITAQILKSVEQIGECLGRLDVVAPALVAPHLRRTNRIKTIQASLEIEGNSLNLEQVTAVLDGKRILGSMREVQEVHNAFQAYENPGHFRSGSVGIQRGADIVHVGPPAERIPQLMADLFDWLSSTDEHLLVASSVFHYEFEFIHPFRDGNGRLGRLWQTLILSHWKPIFTLLPIESIIRDQQKDYYTALRSSDNTGDSIVFVEFMLQAILDGFKDSLSLTDQVSGQVKRIAQALASRPKKALELMEEFGLSHRQTFRKNYLRPALNGGFIEMTQPDKPQSRNQQYRLTSKGRRVFS